MKSSITFINKIKDKKFPILARCKDDTLVILFTGPCRGTVLCKGSLIATQFEVGDHKIDWSSVYGSPWEILDNVTINFKS